VVRPSLHPENWFGAFGEVLTLFSGFFLTRGSLEKKPENRKFLHQNAPNQELDRNFIRVNPDITTLSDGMPAFSLNRS
jgi:hypothetical protein